MSETDNRQPLISASAKQFLAYRLIDLFGICVMAVGVMLTAALLSADVNEPSYRTATGQDVTNWLGLTGAHISSFLYEQLGFIAFMLAVAPLSWGAVIIWKKKLLFWKSRLIVVIFACLLAATGLEGVFGLEDRYSLGGYLGYSLNGILQPLVQSALPSFEPVGVMTGLICLVLSAVLFFWASAAPKRSVTLLSSVFMRALPSVKPLTVRPARSEDDSEAPPSEPAQKKAQKKQRKPKKAAKRREPKLGPATAEGETEPVKADQGSFNFASADPASGEFTLPPLKLLKSPPKDSKGPDDAEMTAHAEQLKQVLEDFRIEGEINDVRYGPVVTRYGLNPAPGTKSQRVIALADDIARSMSAISVRVAVVRGQNIIGIELPNDTREMVLLRHILDAPGWQNFKGGLPVALGKDIAGEPVIADLASMPHLLVAGTTGSGKSVGVNAMILSLLYRFSPEQCRLIMIDPKMLELSVYDGIPHLLSPVVTDPSKAVMALKWTVREMENRYRNMAKLNVRNINGYNQRLAEAREKGEVLTRRVQTGFDPETGKPIYEDDHLDLSPLPYIVVIIDEVADLMLVAGKEIEAAVQRLAQMARAAGIHVIMATQRPSVDVITGTIKANFPTRISFQVTSRIDSRTILGEQGAEQLLGKGDMLYMQGGGRITRIHGPFVDDKEVEDVANFLRAQGEPEYNQSVTEETEDAGAEAEGGSGAGPQATGNSLYDQAVALVIREQKASTSFVQRHLKIGYNRAATLIEEMENAGIISAANHVGKRDVLVQPED